MSTLLVSPRSSADCYQPFRRRALLSAVPACLSSCPTCSCPGGRSPSHQDWPVSVYCPPPSGLAGCPWPASWGHTRGLRARSQFPSHASSFPGVQLSCACPSPPAGSAALVPIVRCGGFYGAVRHPVAAAAQFSGCPSMLYLSHPVTFALLLRP